MKKQSSFRNKILANISNQREEFMQENSAEDRQKRKDAFAEKYDKEKVWKPSLNANMNTFRSLPREIFQEWELSLSALAVYPVLCANADFKRRSMKQLSLKNIAKKAGLSVPTVLKAIDQLCDAEFAERVKHTEGQRTFWIYDAIFIREVDIESLKSEQFFFYTYIIECGIWAKLNLRAKALYLAMRSTSKFDFIDYCDVEGYDYSVGNSEEIYKDRKWEECNESLSALCSMIGMSNSNINDVTEQLIKHGLIDKIETLELGVGGYIVYQFPNGIK